MAGISSPSAMLNDGGTSACHGHDCLNASRTALHWAARAGSDAVLHALLDGLSAPDQAALVNETDSQGITSLFLAQQQGGDPMTFHSTQLCLASSAPA